MAKMAGRIFLVIILFMAIFVAVSCNEIDDPISVAKKNLEKRFPDRPIVFIVPQSHGEITDISIRILQPFLEKSLQTSIKIINVPQNEGHIAWSRLMEEEKTGYIMSSTVFPNMVLQTKEGKDLKYDLNKLQHLAIYQKIPLGFAVKKESTHKNIEDILNYIVKNNGYINFGGLGKLTGEERAFHDFKELTGVRMNYISYNSTANLLADFYDEKFDVLVASANYLLANKDHLNIIAIGSEKRLDKIPSVPTFKELGYNITPCIEIGIALPPNTPKNIVTQLLEGLFKALDDPKYKEEMNERGITTVKMGTKEVNKYLKSVISDPLEEEDKKHKKNR